MTTTPAFEELKHRTMSIHDFTEAFAEPDSTNIIDLIHPVTNRSLYANETLDEIRLRYPNAERVNLQDWMDAKAKRQDSPVEWDEITQAQYDEWLNCLPPAYMGHGGFLVGEPSDHHAGNGKPRFHACLNRHGIYYASSRPMTIAEFKARP